MVWVCERLLTIKWNAIVVRHIGVWTGGGRRRIPLNSDSLICGSGASDLSGSADTQSFFNQVTKLSDFLLQSMILLFNLF